MIFTTIYGLVTLSLIIAFICLCVWAYSPSRRQQFNHDATIPLMGENIISASQGENS
jgi:cbb3-type cytochrome oxidase subunit 3